MPLGHFTIENVMLLAIAGILGFLSFAASIRFGGTRLAKKSIISVAQIICLSVLFEDIAYFVFLRQLVGPADWTAQLLGGFYVPLTVLYVPTWYVIIAMAIIAAQWCISRI